MTSEVCHEWREETADGLVTVYCLGVGQAALPAWCSSLSPSDVTREWARLPGIHLGAPGKEEHY